MKIIGGTPEAGLGKESHLDSELIPAVSPNELPILTHSVPSIPSSRLAGGWPSPPCGNGLIAEMWALFTDSVAAELTLSPQRADKRVGEGRTVPRSPRVPARLYLGWSDSRWMTAMTWTSAV